MRSSFHCGHILWTRRRHYRMDEFDFQHSKSNDSVQEVGVHRVIPSYEADINTLS
jgi:hypothetical protein